MKKRLLKMLAATVFCLVMCAMSVFAANALEIESVELESYTDDAGTVYADYAVMKVNFKKTEESTAEAVSRITFALMSENIKGSLEGNEEKIIFFDEIDYPESGSYTFAVTKGNIRSAVEAAREDTAEANAATSAAADIEGCTLYLKMGGSGVAKAAAYELKYSSPSSENAFVTKTTVTTVGNELKFDVKITNCPESGVIIVGCYDEEERLVTCGMYEITESVTSAAVTAEKRDYKTFKVFAWTADRRIPIKGVEVVD